MTISLDSKSIPKYNEQLVIPPVYEPTVIADTQTGKISHNYTVDVSEFSQQILPSGFPMTTVWGYSGAAKDPLTGTLFPNFKNAPGATFEAIRGIPINIQWVNSLTEPHPLPVDPTLHWADPNGLGMVDPATVPAFPPGLAAAQSPVPIVPHLHGGETESSSDGHPDAWFTNEEAIKGSTFTKSLYTYLNTQLPSTLWYHDHTLGLTRLNVLMGLAGFYLLRDPKNPLDKPNSVLPKGKYEIPIVIQDRSFNTDGSFAFPSLGINPDIHPYWVPEFFGDTITVNGKVWPNLNVERRQYRFRVLNGSNARFYNLQFSNKMTFTQIGSDGGYLPSPVNLTSLLLAPGERADILVDFSGVAAGDKIILGNDASAPFPTGTPADPETVGQIMQFTVLDVPAVSPSVLPARLNTIPALKSDSPKRTLVLIELTGSAGPVEILLDGQKWSAPISELPKVGSTEDWEIVNLTPDAHPIHLHLVQSQVVARQTFQAEQYKTDWIAINGTPPFNSPTTVLPATQYLEGNPALPAANEDGWKDTVKANPGEVTTIRVRFAPQDTSVDDTSPGVNLYPFRPDLGPGYVWHCHIIDHEDNEMMRPYKVIL
ncbi:multicopper oxidase family protein [Clostridium pasteurianum]|uniref:Putative multicopper oxidase n=1 Tax=Clostridium pasteurianum BC1 TaxID=86416 RepID=R4K0N3_CLOPA|nr:multicopper oxidase [Clostridium pasteurianum]AGK96647.1 putative multicopper oxidase [Clostridium pasteurianum BC1]AGK99613.1 putative multicopper oxidase [Clostridium pasteurianum BC1]